MAGSDDLSSLAEEAFDAEKEEGVLTRFHGHHKSKVGGWGRGGWGGVAFS